MRAVVISLSFCLAALPASAQIDPANSYLIAQGFDGAAGEGESNDAFGFDTAAGDFDGDGFTDLAVSAPGEDNGRGVITVFFGSPIGLLGEGAYELRQGENGLDGDDESGDQFGLSIAAGDFDNDGYSDLAVGVPGEDGGRGIAQILYGSPNGLNGDRDQVWDQEDLEGSGRDAGDAFGRSVTVGDFNADGFADLAVGSPGEARAAGVLHVIYGSSSGLTATGNQRWRQDADGIQSNREQNDLFAFELQAGDFNGDGADDLAVGVPGEDGGDGGCAVIFGSPGGGLRSDGNLFLKQGEGGIPDDDEREDAFASVLGAGDFNGDGFDELVIASIGEDNGRGIVIVIPGSASGPTGAGSMEWRQDSAGTGDEQNDGNRFGTSLVAGDFNADGFQDLAIGSRGEDQNRGLVQIVYGSASGLTATGSQRLQEGLDGFAGEARPGDDFGSALAVGNFGYDAAQDLAIGAPTEENGQNRGTVYIVHGLGLDIVSSGLSDPFVFEGSYNAILSVFGPNFAPVGTTGSGELVNGLLGTNVAGICVEMDGERAPIFYAQWNQVNFQARVGPDQDISIVTVVSNCGLANERRSLPIPLPLLPAAPEFFFYGYGEGGRNPVRAIVNDTPQRLGPAELGPAYRPARVDDVITVFVTGFGDTSPRFAPGEIVNAAAPTIYPVTLELGGRAYQPIYAGATPRFAGLYQVSFIPDPSTPSGDLDLKLTVQTPQGPISTPAGAYLTFE